MNFRTFILSMAMCLAMLNAQSQNKKLIDSLRAAIKTVSKKEKTISYISLCIAYAENNASTAMSYADSAYVLARAEGDSALIVRSGRIMGQLLRRLNLLDSSLNMLNVVLPVAKRIKATEDYKRILNALALGYTYKGNYDDALKYHFQSLVIREGEGNKAEMSITLNNIGLTYFKLDDYERALTYYERALALKKEVKDNYDLDRLLINLALCENQLHKYDLGIKFINEAFAVCKDNCSKSIQMEGKYGLGIALKETRKLTEAEQYFKEAFVLAKELEDVSFQLDILKSLARINIRNHKEDEAEAQLNEAEKIAQGKAYNQILIEIYREFSLLYNQKKDYEKAAAYQNRYIILKDSIFSKELIKNLTIVQNDYEQRVNIKTIADKDTALALKEETLKRQASEARFYVVISVFVLVLAALMFLLFRMTQRANNLLEVRVERRTRELNDSNEALAKVNGELDNFIYKTSHDIRGPLASLKGICNVAILDVRDEAALGYLQKLDFTAEKLNRILTRLLIINQINHAVLASNIIIFEELLEDILFLERKKGVPKRLKIFYEIEKGFVLKSDKEMLRIVLENLIDNGIKFYSESDRVDPFVKIFIYAVEGQIVIKVIDNGVGINAETKEKIFQMFVRASERSETGGIGLYLARLATGRLEGKIEFRTTPEKYTEFSVKLPMDLAPILEERAEQERIREFEKIRQVEKMGKFTVS